jgi:ElaB/YqjD/DUF883 family membrane-anchored ribosome-binding protein
MRGTFANFALFLTLARRGREAPIGPKRGGVERRMAHENDIGRVASEAAKASEALIERTKSAVRDAGAETWDVGQRAAAQARSMTDEISNQGGRALDSVRQQVSSDPLTGLLVAGAIGYLLGYISHRR